MSILFKLPNSPIKYFISLEIVNKLSSPSLNQLTYSYEIQRKKNTLDGYVVNFKRNDVLLNHTRVHEPLNEIAIISGQLFEDLDLEISHYGDILKVKNFNEIQQNWEQIKFKIECTYLGDMVGKILKKLDQNVTDEKLFIDSLRRDFFFHNYLYHIFGKYTNGILSKSEIITNLGGLKKIEIEKKYTKEKMDDEYTVRGEGKLTPTSEKLVKEKNELLDFTFNTIHKIQADGQIETIISSQKLTELEEIVGSKIIKVQLLKQ